MAIFRLYGESGTSEERHPVYRSGAPACVMFRFMEKVANSRIRFMEKVVPQLLNIPAYAEKIE